jgi:coiled-coil domain-containing protein 151
VIQDNDKDEQKQIERDVENLRRELDEMKLRSSRLKKVLDAETDKARTLELDSHRPHMEDNEYTRRIRALENKLDKAMIKYNEAQSIKKTYEQIVKRLQEERIGYDNQLSIMERTLNAKKRDHEELVVLSGDSLHAKEMALNELERVRSGYEEERKRREKELKERFNVIQLRKQMLQKIKEREKLRQELEEEYGRSTQEANEQAAKQMLMEKIEQKNKIEIFENAFRKIKESTGVSDVNEVINKIISQESTTENLVQLTQENQKKLETLLDEKKDLKEKVEEMKYNGLSGGIRRKLVDDSEDQLTNSVGRLERNRVRYDKLNKLIISIKAGIGHLQDKLSVIRYDDTFQSLIKRDDSASQKMTSVAGTGVAAAMNMKQSSSKPFEQLTDDNVVDVLNEQESLLSSILKFVVQGEERIKSMAEKRSPTTGYFSTRQPNLNESIEASQTTESLSFTSFDEQGMMIGHRPFNQRVDIPLDDQVLSREPSARNLLDEHAEAAMYNKTSTQLNDHEDDEITRDLVKRNSSHYLSIVDKKKKKSMTTTTIGKK